MEPQSFYGTKRFCKLSEALKLIRETESELEEADLVIIPPEAAVESENEEFDDDNIMEGDVTDVCGTLELHAVLLENGENFDANDILSEEKLSTSKTKKNIICKTKKRKRGTNAMLFESNNNSDEPGILSQEKASTSKAKKSKIEKTIVSWKRKQPSYSWIPKDLTDLRCRQNNIIDLLHGKNELEVFEIIFTSDIVDYIIEQTEKYAGQCNFHTFKTSREEMKAFLGILLFTGYHHVPRQRYYWSTDEDLGIEMVRRCMPRNRFEEIKRYIHFADNTNFDNNDRLYKLCPLMDKLNKSFQQFGVFHENLSIDESMIKYFGKHSLKQFISGKPIRFGYKDWMLCGSDDGYCYKFDTYAGKKTKKDIASDNDSSLPLGSSVVLDLIDVLKNPREHNLFFDNFFTSIDLLVTLKNMGLRATGTLRANRSKKCPVKSKAEMQKEPRATYDYQFDTKNELLLVTWKDNSVVSIATNYDTIKPTATVQRYSKENKVKLNVPQPKVFRTYNAGMGGVDLLDQSVNCYRCGIKSKKWYWVLFTHMLNMSIVNSWRLFQMTDFGIRVDLLSFMRFITRAYMRCFMYNPTRKIQQSRGLLPGTVTANKSKVHALILMTTTQRRCRLCHMRTKWICQACDAILCQKRDCFATYHSS